MINWIATNWYALIVAFAVVLVAWIAVYVFVRKSTAAQINAMQEWLKYAVTMAEKEFGSGTGQLKLRMVYDLFVQKFEYAARFMSFETFSEYVDKALVWLNGQLSSNKAVATFVESGNKNTETETANDTNNT